MEKVSQLAARIFLGHLFVLATAGKIAAYEGTQGYMEAMGVPGMLLPLVIPLQVGGGLSIIIGWKTRWAAIALAAFPVAAAIIFHSGFSDQSQLNMFMENIAITGGFLLLAVHGAAAYSMDKLRPITTPAVSHS